MNREDPGWTENLTCIQSPMLSKILLLAKAPSCTEATHWTLDRLAAGQGPWLGRSTCWAKPYVGQNPLTGQNLPAGQKLKIPVWLKTLDRQSSIMGRNPMLHRILLLT